MKRRRGFTVAETLTAGASTVLVGGIAISAFLSSASASAIANNRFASSRELYKLSVQLRNDIEQSSSSELVNASNIKLTTKNVETGDVSLVEYKLNSEAQNRVERWVNGTRDTQVASKVQSIQITRVSENCVSYQLTLPASSSEPAVVYKGEVRLRNWVKA